MVRFKTSSQKCNQTTCFNERRIHSELQTQSGLCLSQQLSNSALDDELHIPCRLLTVPTVSECVCLKP